MDFTELYKHSSSLVAFSPGAKFISTAIADRIIVRRTENFQIFKTWLIDPNPSESTPSLSKPTLKSGRLSSEAKNIISHIDWSCDSEHILAACAKGRFLQVFKLVDEEWKARIDCGAEGSSRTVFTSSCYSLINPGLVKAVWAPDGRTILCFSEWGLRVTVYSLVTRTATYIQYPIYPSDRGSCNLCLNFCLTELS